MTERSVRDKMPATSQSDTSVDRVAAADRATNPGGATDPANLLSRFGLTSFRPGQREVVDAVAAGQDVMCVMPTGGGKSLCYQLPSLARRGTTIVVSPLIALMKDQVDTMHRLGIRARLINSSLSQSQQADVMREMASGDLDLVYVAPERLRNHRFLESVAPANVTLLAVDEAHCVSEWGHDFRPDYSRLGQFRQRYLNNVQTIALTATATPTVREDICSLLQLQEPQVFVTGFARTNLRFGVSHCKTDREKSDQLAAYLQQQTGAGIIYAATRKRCEELAEWLPSKANRPIGVYHGGMHPDERRRVQELFMHGDLPAIVATNAFGMGIDKSNIRYVVHFNMPGSLEAYYQEAGRAGRDGQMSDCALMFSYNDRYIQEFFIENRYPSRETVRKVYEYLLSRDEDPIEMTLDQVRDAINVKDGSEAIGTSETLLARAGVLKRLDSNANYAMLRIDSNAPTMLDFLPKEAKLRRKVMTAIEKIVGRRRGEDVFVRPTRLAEMAGVERDQLARTLRELQRLKAFDYVPPFRGRAVHFTQRDIPFDDLNIDFEELERRKAVEYQKLEAVIGFARTSGCRQRVILDYFGDPDVSNCGNCDRCAPSDTPRLARGNDVSANEPLRGVNNDALIRGVQVVLSGVARMHGRFGKNLVAQMLCGSKNKKLQQWKLHRLSTYGLLGVLKQSEVVEVIDALVQAGMLEQREVDQRRPTIQLTDPGRRVMKSVDPMPDSVRLKFPIAKRLAAAARSLEAADVPQSDSAADANGQPTGQAQATAPAESHATPDSAQQAEDSGGDEFEAALVQELTDRLKRFRRKRAAALGLPAFQVLTNATIGRIAVERPMDSVQLEAISGVGQSTIEQIGQDILELIAEVVSTVENELGADAEVLVQNDSPEADLPADKRSETESAKPEGSRAAVATQGADADESAQVEQDPSSTELEPAVPANENAADAYWTWRLFRDGYTDSQLVEIRRCTQDQLLADLVAAAKAGHAVDPNWLSHAPSRQALQQFAQPQ